MGQSNSRHRNIESTSQSVSSAVTSQPDVIEHDGPDTTDTQPSDDIVIPSQTKPSGRPSRRQNLKRLICTKFMRNRMDSSTSNSDGQPSRKRWRTSRRISKAPEGVNGQPLETITSAPEDSSEGLDASAASSSTNVNEKEDGELDIAPVDRPATPSTVSGPSDPVIEGAIPDSSFTENEQGTSSNTGTSMDGQRSLAPNLGLDEDEVVISPSAFTEEQGDDAGVNVRADMTDEIQSLTQPVEDGQAPIPTPLPPPPAASDTQPSRQFPPPGTLVVVQGVVHTTDVSRPQAPTPITSAANLALPSRRPSTMSNNPRRASSYIPSSTPSRIDTGFPRSRRPSVLPRPPSVRARPFSMVESSTTASSTIESSSDSELNGTNDSETTPTSNGSGSDTRTPVSEPPTPILSPSSIDVLGTLLSVAAAATAASLLTGSSDPIFTPGLDPSVNGTVPQSTTNYERPTSPTPTAGLGTFGSLPSGFGLGAVEAASPQAQGSGRRMRHAWGSLRERLGWRAAGNDNASAGPGNETNIHNRARPDGTPMDAREIMLAEMARAFNLGLGIGGAGAASNTGAGVRAGGEDNSGQQENSHSPSATPPAQAQGVPLPAEGSFERFLVDLQADLRTALSGQSPPPNQLPHIQRSDHEANPQLNVPSSTVPTAVVDQDAQPMSAEATGHVNIGTRTLSDATPADQDIEAEEDEGLPPLSHILHPDGLADEASPEVGTQLHIPASFRPATRSDNESDVADGDLAETAETPRVPRPSGIAESGPTLRTERRPGGINWWRSYRFPPITSPHAHGLATTLNSMNSAATSPLATTHPTGSASETSTIQSSSASPAQTNSSQDPEPDTSNPAAENRSNIVIPVIVVGLQSVNMDRDQATPFGDNDGAFGTNHNEPEAPALGGDVNFDGMLGDGDSGAPQQGRTWHSRAANAFRNLRPGRRASRTIPATGGPGSRTFLIYVIGGYYPPEHSLITGANALDSFEALWELADLLGQVKPQTVSKEEIDNSGLEVIKSTALERYERDGKVASNCLDRCLVCLDDYAPEDDLRLLSCKHAFHRTCVDQWLQIGKNNCPACRTKGVSSGSESNATTQPM